MKKIAICLLFVCGIASAQDKDANEPFRFNLGFRLGYLQPVATGSTALAEGFTPKWGIGNEVDLVSWHHFRLGYGMALEGYEVSDKDIVGAFSNGFYSSFFGALSYNRRLSDKWVLTPSLSVGAANFDMSGATLKVISQNGTEFRLGSSLNYQLGRGTYVYVSAFYAMSKMGVRSTAEFADYYGKMSHFQLQLGIYFD